MKTEKVGKGRDSNIENFMKKGKGKGNRRRFFDYFKKFTGIGMVKGNVKINFYLSWDLVSNE